jgi:outer membrane protein assembly factor BamB
MNLLLLALALTARTDNWPEFRGPNRDGTTIQSVPVEFGENKNLKWKVPIHGRGWSTPVIWGRQIWMTTATIDGLKMYVVCVDKETGRVLLDRLLFTNDTVEPIADINSYASPSACIEEGRVYVHFGKYGTACIDTNSFETVWQRRDIRISHSVGPGSTPILWKDLLILTMDGTDEQFTVALDKRNGREVWKKARGTSWDLPNGSKVAGEMRKAFSTPILVEQNGRTLLVCAAARYVYANDITTGAEVWKGFHGGYSNSARAALHNGLVIINSGYDRAELFAYRLGGTGDISTTGLAWRYSRRVPNKPSPALVDGLLYFTHDGGVTTCLNATTGEEIWQDRLDGTFSASPLVAGGRIYFFNEQGVCTVLQPGRTKKVLAENTLESGCMASAAVSGKALFVRTKTHLYRFEE